MQNSTQIAPTNVFLNKDFLSRLLPLHVAKKWVKTLTLPSKNSSTLEVARIERIAPLTGASFATVKSYVEGQTPGDTSFTLTKVQLTTALYAHLVRATDQVDLLNERQILNEVMKLNTENMSDVVELIINGFLNSGTNVYRLTDSIGATGGAARVNVVGLLNPTVLDKAVRFMESGNVPTFTKAVSAGTGFATSPIDACWIALCHPDTALDLRQMPDFLRVENYPSGAAALDGEVGKYNRIRFIASTLQKIYPDLGAAVAGTKSTTGTYTDVYATIILGEGAAAYVDLTAATDVIHISSKSPDHADPLGLTDALGYKFRSGGGILEDARILRIEHGVSA
jgi:N4-gp56 family major capsid protein